MEHESNQKLKILLEKATEDELMAIQKIFLNSPEREYGIEKLIDRIRFSGTGTFSSLPSSYSSVVQNLAKKLKVENFEIEKRELTQPEIIDLENKIVTNLMKKIYESLDEDQKKQWDQELQKHLKQYGSSSTKIVGGVGGLMVLGNLGGFATYTFLTSAMSTLSLGTLGFGAYTAATSTLSVLLGPVGWTALGVYGIYALGKPSHKKAIQAVLEVYSIRQRTGDDSIKQLTNRA